MERRAAGAGALEGAAAVDAYHHQWQEQQQQQWMQHWPQHCHLECQQHNQGEVALLQQYPLAALDGLSTTRDGLGSSSRTDWMVPCSVCYSSNCN